MARSGREGTPARGPVGILDDGPVGTAVEDEEGPEGMDGEGVWAGRLTGVVPRVGSSTGAVRVAGAAPHELESGRCERSLPNEPLPPRMKPLLPRAEGTKPRGPEGGTMGPGFSDRLWADMEVVELGD